MNIQSLFLVLCCLLLSSAQAQDMSRANRAYQQGDLAKAQAILTDVLSQQPTNADAFYLMGNIKQQQGDRQAAQEAYRQYVRQTTNSPDPERLIHLRRSGFY